MKDIQIHSVIVPVKEVVKSETETLKIDMEKTGFDLVDPWILDY